MRPRADRMLTREQQIKQNSKLVDVRCGRNHSASELLRRGKLRRERSSRLKSEHCCGAVPASSFKQLGDTEVQQLDDAVIAYQYVGWLDVAMNDQVRVRMRDRAQHVQEQANPRAHVQIAFIAKR